MGWCDEVVGIYVVSAYGPTKGDVEHSAKDELGFCFNFGICVRTDHHATESVIADRRQFVELSSSILGIGSPMRECGYRKKVSR